MTRLVAEPVHNGSVGSVAKWEEDYPDAARRSMCAMTQGSKNREAVLLLYSSSYYWPALGSAGKF